MHTNKLCSLYYFSLAISCQRNIIHYEPEKKNILQHHPDMFRKASGSYCSILISSIWIALCIWYKRFSKLMMVVLPLPYGPRSPHFTGIYTKAYIF
jgi:hypothetical protein